MSLPSVVAICATSGRHKCVERALSFFLKQDYDGPHTLLIYNNAHVPQVLNLPDILPDNKRVILINNNVDSKTGYRYRNLGAIYNDTLKYIPESSEVICFWDDDDIFLKNHITEGVSGLLSGGKSAYKPARSWYFDENGISLVSNTLEPSMFVKAQHIKDWGFSEETTEQHLHWLRPLLENSDICVDEAGKPTFIYDWSHEIPTFKTSGDFKNPTNFENYLKNSQDHGDGIVSPVKDEVVDYYYNLIK